MTIVGLNYRQHVASAAAPRNGRGSGKQVSICFADPGETNNFFTRPHVGSTFSDPYKALLEGGLGFLRGRTRL